MKLSFQNASNLIFYNKKVQKILPEFYEIFKKWNLAIRVNNKRLEKESILALINNISEEQIQKLSEYWKSPVEVQKLDNRITINIVSSLDSLEEKLINWDNLCIARNGDTVYLSFWR